MAIVLNRRLGTHKSHARSSLGPGILFGIKLGQPAKSYYKQKYDEYKQLLDIKLRQDVSQGSYDNVIQDYHAGYTRGELCTKYKLSYLKLKIILRDKHSFKIPSLMLLTLS